MKLKYSTSRAPSLTDKPQAIAAHGLCSTSITAQFLVAFFVLSLFAIAAQAETKLNSEESSVFLFLSTPNEYTQLNPENLALLHQANIKQDSSLRFNQIWINQYKSDYKHKSGGAAIGKIFRMSFKSWYRSLDTSSEPIVINHQQNLNLQEESSMNYGLRLSNSKVKMKVEYKF